MSPPSLAPSARPPGRARRDKLTGTVRVTAAVGKPPNFERLERFFASQTALARALGVHRDTVRAWEHGDSTRLRHSSIERVNTICAVAEQVTRDPPA